MPGSVPFSIGVRAGSGAKSNLAEFEKALRSRVEDLNISVNIGAQTSYTLSNCRDTATDCTCDVDD